MRKVYFNTLNHILSEISLLDNFDLKASKIKSKPSILLTYFQNHAELIDC